MEARVKATGEIIDVYESCVEDFPWTDEMGDKIWKTEELMFLETADNTLDYWTRLEHQYVGMAMQGILSGDSIMERIAKFKVEDLPSLVADLSIQCAHALVEKLKEKEERK